MTTKAFSLKAFSQWASLTAGRWWRIAQYQWLNKSVLADVGVAALLFCTFIPMSFRIALNSASPSIGAAIFFLMPPVLMATGFAIVRRYLKQEADYEGLRSARKPVVGKRRADRTEATGVTFSDTFVTPLLSKCWDGLLTFPCTAVVVFALLSGFAFWSLGLCGLGQAIRLNLMHVLSPLPPLAGAVRWCVGEETARLPAVLSGAMSLIYTVLVFALVAAWWKRSTERANYVASLFSDGPRARSPYGTCPKGTRPEPHEQVLLMQGPRIGSACLPYLRAVLSGPEWQKDPRAPDRCRGAIAAIAQIFSSSAAS